MPDSDFDPSLSGMHTQDEKVIPQEIVPQTVHQDLSPLIMVLLMVFMVGGLVAWKVYSVWDENRPVYQKRYLPQKEVSVKVLLSEMQEYVRQSYPSSNKRLVVYAPELNSDTCPYRRDFVRSFYQEKDNPQWKAYYDFVPQVRQVQALTQKELDVQLKKLHNFIEKVCGYISIIDIQENWVFEIPTGSALPDALNAFKKNSLSLM